MQWLSVSSSIFKGVLFVTVSYLLSGIVCHSQKKPYRPIGLIFVSILTFISVFLVDFPGLSNFNEVNIEKTLQVTVSLVVMSLIAFCDLRSSRIPLALLILSLIVGFYVGVFTSRLQAVIFGGSINILVGFVIYAGGKKYPMKRFEGDVFDTSFGFGDVYGSGAVGFLLGFPLGIIGLLVAFVMAIIGAVFQSVIFHKKLLRMRIRLGIYYYLAVILILFLILPD